MRRLLLGFAFAVLAAAPVWARAAEPEFKVTPVAAKVVERLPEGPLFWRVETYADLPAAKAAAGPLSLAVDVDGKGFLFTLGPKGGASAGATKLAEIGPVPPIQAKRHLLRINRAGGPPGAKTPVHTHPGSEAFYVLKGQLTQKTSHGAAKLGAGAAMNGHAPGMVMQLESTGSEPLDQLVMFDVDADQPFSSPAAFEDPASRR